MNATKTTHDEEFALLVKIAAATRATATHTLLIALPIWIMILLLIWRLFFGALAR